MADSSLANGGLVVVIGGRATNFAPEHWAHPQVHFITGGEAEHLDRFPTNTRTVIVTQWVTHSALKKIHLEAGRRGLHVLANQTSGRVRVRLNELLGTLPSIHTTLTPPSGEDAAPSVPRPMPDPTPPVRLEDGESSSRHTAPPVRGWVASFLRAHARLDAAVPVDEITRLVGLASEQGFVIPRTTMAAGYYLVRKQPPPARFPGPALSPRQYPAEMPPPLWMEFLGTSNPS